MYRAVTPGGNTGADQNSEQRYMGTFAAQTTSIVMHVGKCSTHDAGHDDGAKN